MPLNSLMASTMLSLEEYTSPSTLPHSSATTVVNRPSVRSVRMHSARVTPRHSRLPCTSALPPSPGESTCAGKATSTSSRASAPTTPGVTGQPGWGMSTRRELTPAIALRAFSVAALTLGVSLGSRKAPTPARSRSTSSAGPRDSGSSASPPTPPPLPPPPPAPSPLLPPLAAAGPAVRLAPTTRTMTRCAGREDKASTTAPIASEEAEPCTPRSQSKNT
jgi:hypothetical protein